MRSIYTVFGFFLCASAFSAHAQVGVAPIRVDFSPGRLNGSVTITNDTDRTLTMQPTPMLWQQDASGNDQLTPTRDFIAAPPLIEIPPKQKQVVRVALRAVEPQDKERTYRLLVREVPPTRPDGAPAGLQFTLNLSIPVFAYPLPGKAAPSVELFASTVANADRLALTVKNTGQSHLQMREIRVLSGETVVAQHEVMMYVLPGITRALEVPLLPAHRGGVVATKPLTAEVINTREPIRTEIRTK
jgi:fimbrial chaperone protein